MKKYHAFLLFGDVCVCAQHAALQLPCIVFIDYVSFLPLFPFFVLELSKAHCSYHETCTEDCLIVCICQHMTGER